MAEQETTHPVSLLEFRHCQTQFRHLAIFDVTFANFLKNVNNPPPLSSADS